jgi:hypothetical protein
MKKTKSKKPAKAIRRIEDLRPDPKNANRHTERGGAMMETSIERFGFGDSLTVDKDGVVISGNQRLETLATAGLGDPIIVQSDGSRPIVHQRIDLSANDPRARALAVAMNRVGEVNLDWDPELLREVIEANSDLKSMFSERELVTFLATKASPEEFPEVGDDLAVEHICPRCGYSFSGGATSKSANVDVKKKSPK